MMLIVTIRSRNAQLAVRQSQVARFNVGAEVQGGKKKDFKRLQYLRDSKDLHFECYLLRPSSICPVLYAYLVRREGVFLTSIGVPPRLLVRAT
jgi:hypothetical protein